MIVWKIIIIFKFIIITNKTLCVRVHTEFGDYNYRIKKELWNQNCGLTKVLKERENMNSQNCFKFKTPLRQLMAMNENSESDETKPELNNRIMKGEFAAEGEAPWAAHIVPKPGVTSCGGVILNKRWVMTASHCLGYSYNYNCGLSNTSHTTFNTCGHVYVGNRNRDKATKYTFNNAFKNNKYRNHCYDDIGLIKIDGEFNFNAINGSYRTNSVCLPKKDLINSEPEFATMYGWGLQHNTSTSRSLFLKKGNFLLDRNPIFRSNLCYRSNHTNTNQPLACYGDSGSGLIQFIGPNKRAVVIGILSDGASGPKFENCGDIESFWSPVSHHIDWLLNVINKY